MITVKYFFFLVKPYENKNGKRSLIAKKDLCSVNSRNFLLKFLLVIKRRCYLFKNINLTPSVTKYHKFVFF